MERRPTTLLRTTRLAHPPAVSSVNSHSHSITPPTLPTLLHYFTPVLITMMGLINVSMLWLSLAMIPSPWACLLSRLLIRLLIRFFVPCEWIFNPPSLWIVPANKYYFPPDAEPHQSPFPVSVVACQAHNFRRNKNPDLVTGSFRYILLTVAVSQFLCFLPLACLRFPSCAWSSLVVWSMMMKITGRGAR